jgi:hypothetical protein
MYIYNKQKTARIDSALYSLYSLVVLYHKTHSFEDSLVRSFANRKQKYDGHMHLQ